jgi:pyruvate/2-oxoacid:ferredoxin oxidoreductase alpha subunit
MGKNSLEEANNIVCDGNKAAAHAVRLCRPDIISFYPITPQTPLLESLYEWSGNGMMDADFVEVEGETSAIAVVSGASAAGGRTFTATSGAGLAYMYSGYLWPPAFRLPVVMANVNREQSPPVQVAGGNSDMMSVKDGGWIQIHVEDCQEVLDTLIMAYRLAEDPEILLPVQVSYDGFVLSHLS